MSIGDLKSYKVLPIMKSSPQGPKSYRHLISSYMCLKDSSLFPYIEQYLDITKSSNLQICFRNIEYLIKAFNISKPSDHLHLGKLSFKEEAAGKLRVFAMVDIITQSILHPLHTVLFDLFKTLPNDCTHDQDKGVKYAQELSMKYGCSYGFDLSSATDRLPLSSQMSVLNSIFGSYIGYL